MDAVTGTADYTFDVGLLIEYYALMLLVLAVYFLIRGIMGK